VIDTIGKGGMGEVFLAYDTTCGRRIALKKIRSDLQEHKKMHNRFLREARITSQLTHPAIIPIYQIHKENKAIYYTMPYVEGHTLKQLIQEARKREKKGEPLEMQETIPSLLRLFLTVCQAIAYAHSQNVLHRDLKPENIILGPFGEVFILDWGLAKIVCQEEEEESTLEEETLTTYPELTLCGKVVGTVNYMAPERALGQKATYQTDIYSLGVILYQILTLKSPFKRGTLKEFREKIGEEELKEPEESHPYRDIPEPLVRIVKKALNNDLKERYKTVSDLIFDIENHIEGHSEWFLSGELRIDRPNDWEFQENVFIAEHIAITRGQEVADWVSLMISKASSTGDVKLEAELILHENSQGIGFLLSIPEALQREHLNDGYCLWLGSDENRTTKLLRSTVEVLHAPEIYLEREKPYVVRIEKRDNNIYFYLNHQLQFSYISHLPLMGTHVGLITRDADFSITPIALYTGSQNITVSCLKIPDAFLANKDFGKALSEYRRIAYSFPGRSEGREAVFKAGITLLEEGKTKKTKEEREAVFEEALKEFEKLHKSPGAPLEYLGKALVYKALKETDEEIKCFELAYRRNPKHPLLSMIEEQINHRMHESSRYNRKTTYHFILLAIQHLSKTQTSAHTKRLYKNVQKHWEELPFLLDEDPLESSRVKSLHFGSTLAFWLAKPYVIGEIIESLLEITPLPKKTLFNALTQLFVLRSFSFLKTVLEKVKPFERELPALFTSFFEKNLSDFNPEGEEEFSLALLEFLYDEKKTDLCLKIGLELPQTIDRDVFLLFIFFKERDLKKVGALLSHYPLEELTLESSPLHFFYGCYLLLTEEKELFNLHFSQLIVAPDPKSYTLFAHYLNSTDEERRALIKRAFLYEKRVLYRQLSLYYNLTGDFSLSEEFHSKCLEERIDINC
jgi:serine/threonine-protein kinase